MTSKSPVARADLLVRLVAEVLSAAPPPLASTARLARLALHELRAMVPDIAAQAPQVLPHALVERLAQAAALPELEALEYRRAAGRSMTQPELDAWRRIELFAALVAAAARAPDTSMSTSGAGQGAAPQSPAQLKTTDELRPPADLPRTPQGDRACPRFL